MALWSDKEAEMNFDKLIRTAFKQGPQFVVGEGQEVVVMSRQEYDKCKAYKTWNGKKPSFLELLASSPLKGLDLNFERNDSF